MEIKVEHLVTLIAVTFLAYAAGKRKAMKANGQGGTATDANRTTSQAQWWSYAGSWQQ